MEKDDQPIFLSRDALRKRKSRENETSNQREIRLAGDRKSKQNKTAEETIEQRQTRLRRERERMRKKRSKPTLGNINDINRQNENQDRNIVEQQLPESDRELLQKFREKLNKIAHEHCPTCNERFPSIKLVKGECRRCYFDKNPVKKFSLDNNMDPGDVPDELRGLTEIEEMLIAQIFPIVSVYCLRGGQHAYRGW
jgi:hypothetical protein